MAAKAEIAAVEASAYTVPTDAPEADGTSAWSDTTLVPVQIWADGEVGTGWTYGSMGTAALIRQTLASILTTSRWLTSVGCGRRCSSRCATSAALVSGHGIVGGGLRPWDLKARLLGVPLFRLLGGVRDDVPIYGSGGFTSYDDDQLVAQLSGWVYEDGIPRVKIKIGESWGSNESRDIARMRRAREVVGDDVELYVDANGAYAVGQAVRLAPTLDELDVRWFEEPVSSDDLKGLRHVRQRTRADVTAREHGYSLDYFQRMCAADALDCLQVDVTRCGGISELLCIAAVAAAHHLQVSGHCATAVSALAAVPNLRHLEWFHDHARC